MDYEHALNVFKEAVKASERYLNDVGYHETPAKGVSNWNFEITKLEKLSGGMLEYHLGSDSLHNIVNDAKNYTDSINEAYKEGIKRVRRY